MNNKVIDIIVPCYNESKTLNLFRTEVQRAVSEIEGYDFKYIFIDDGSQDSTLDIIKSFAADDEQNVRYISFSRNVGKGDYAVIMDADLQHPPQLISEMVGKIEMTGADSCAARRVSRKGEPKIRSFLARSFY